MSKKLSLFFILGIIIYSILLSFAISTITSINLGKRGVFFVTNAKSFIDSNSNDEKFGCRVDYTLETNTDKVILVEYIEAKDAKDCDGLIKQETISQSEFINKVTNYQSRVVENTNRQDETLINTNLLKK